MMTTVSGSCLQNRGGNITPIKKKLNNKKACNDELQAFLVSYRKLFLGNQVEGQFKVVINRFIGDVRKERF